MYTHIIIPIYTCVHNHKCRFQALSKSSYGVQPLRTWCDLYTAANDWRAESQSGLTHEKYIPTYQFENTLCISELSCWWFMFLKNSHHPLRYIVELLEFPIFNLWVSPLQFLTLQLWYAISITCFLFIYFRRRSSTVTLRLVLSTHSISVHLCNK